MIAVGNEGTALADNQYKLKLLCESFVLVLYVGCIVSLYMRATVGSAEERRALRVEKELLTSILLIVALYVVFHVVPNAILTVCWVCLLAVLCGTVVFAVLFQVFAIHLDFVGPIAQLYGIGTGIYSGATTFIYIARHRLIRACFFELLGVRIKAAHEVVPDRKVQLQNPTAWIPASGKR